MWIEINGTAYNFDHVVRIEQDAKGNAILKSDDGTRYVADMPYSKLRDLLTTSRRVSDNTAEKLRQREEFFKGK